METINTCDICGKEVKGSYNFQVHFTSCQKKKEKEEQKIKKKIEKQLKEKEEKETREKLREEARKEKLREEEKKQEEKKKAKHEKEKVKYLKHKFQNVPKFLMNFVLFIARLIANYNRNVDIYNFIGDEQMISRLLEGKKKLDSKPISEIEEIQERDLNTLVAGENRKKIKDEVERKKAELLKKFDMEDRSDAEKNIIFSTFSGAQKFKISVKEIVSSGFSHVGVCLRTNRYYKQVKEEDREEEMSIMNGYKKKIINKIRELYPQDFPSDDELDEDLKITVSNLRKNDTAGHNLMEKFIRAIREVISTGDSEYRCIWCGDYFVKPMNHIFCQKCPEFNGRLEADQLNLSSLIDQSIARYRPNFNKEDLPFYVEKFQRESNNNNTEVLKSVYSYINEGNEMMARRESAREFLSETKNMKIEVHSNVKVIVKDEPKEIKETAEPKQEEKEKSKENGKVLCQGTPCNSEDESSEKQPDTEEQKENLHDLFLNRKRKSPSSATIPQTNWSPRIAQLKEEINNYRRYYHWGKIKDTLFEKEVKLVDRQWREGKGYILLAKSIFNNIVKTPASHEEKERAKLVAENKLLGKEVQRFEEDKLQWGESEKFASKIKLYDEQIKENRRLANINADRIRELDTIIASQEEDMTKKIAHLENWLIRGEIPKEEDPEDETELKLLLQALKRRDEDDELFGLHELDL